ncbi:hypothetical protein BDV29DRAFT_45610 [Aspergillus leporis]|uniref:Uncharacterized protein n=1 Tax=Aspergillus leporis TaxID=41062 RepID=A0A5N5XA79_9EURO|nr:hypothetical protein BDV29DRAFT_45610 [Aspergillus leporis]
MPKRQDNKLSNSTSSRATSARSSCKYCGRHSTSRVCWYQNPEAIPSDKATPAFLKRINEYRATKGDTAYTPQDPNPKPSASANCIAESNIQPTDWYVDTCASFHMTRRQDVFSSYETLLLAGPIRKEALSTQNTLYEASCDQRGRGWRSGVA